MSHVDNDLTIVIFGASGDLATKKVYPAFLSLYSKSLLPKNFNIIGYARSNLNTDIIMERLGMVSTINKDVLNNFRRHNQYIQGFYDQKSSFENLKSYMDSPSSNRLYYMALPPDQYKVTSSLIRDFCMETTGWVRIIYEKPFGRDLDSSNDLSNHLTWLFDETHLYRMDHYLGKEILLNLVALRFGNRVLSTIWNRHHIKSVTVSLKEDFGVGGRAGYFDNYGIIRDVMQNHLLQIVTLVALEAPNSTYFESIREEKVKLLRHIKEATLDNTVVGQYGGYLEEDGVAESSKTSTLAATVLYVDNDRWRGVPFILKAGKEMDERKCEVRIEFKESENDLFGGHNELLLCVGPSPSIVLRIRVKRPDAEDDYVDVDLGMKYSNCFNDYTSTDPYETLILQAIQGNQSNFVRTDELEEAWRIFSPLLSALEKHVPLEYPRGSCGVQQVEEMIKTLIKNN